MTLPFLSGARHALRTADGYAVRVSGEVKPHQTWSFACNTGVRREVREVYFDNGDAEQLPVALRHRDAGGHLECRQQLAGVALNQWAGKAAKEFARQRSLPAVLAGRFVLLWASVCEWRQYEDVELSKTSNR